MSGDMGDLTPRVSSALQHLEQAREAADRARRAMIAEAEATRAMRNLALDYWIQFREAKDFTTADVIRDLIEEGGWRIAGGHKDAKDGRADYHLERLVE